MYTYNNIPSSVKEELAAHILDAINEERINNDNGDDWHFHLFNEDYYIIGYYQCEQWLKNHGISTFEAVKICQEYEKDNFGEARIYDNAETTVNMLAYIFGEAMLSEADASNIEELTEAMEQY
jgi:hypothetical protein